MRSLFLFALVLAFPAAQAQGSAQSAGADSFARFTYTNDFFTATDRYFTQGVGLRYGSRGLGTSLLVAPLLRLSNTENAWGIALLQQDCFTPASIRTDTIRPLDRPFAAALYAGIEAVTVDPVRGLKLRSSLLIGVLGPCASCAEEQRWIHHGLGNIEPLGWQYQVASDVLLNYGVNMEKRLFATPWLEGRGGVGAMVGSYQDNTSAAFTLLLGKNATAFEEWGTRPSKPRFQAFGDAKLTFVAYDAAIQGGVFQQHDPHTLTGAELERVVVGYGWGARFRYRSLELQYREWYIGRTFQNGLRHGWGTVTLAGWF